MVQVILKREYSGRDEVDFEEYLDEVMKDTIGWVKPPLLVGEREVDSILGRVPEDEWKDKIKKLLPIVEDEDIKYKERKRATHQFGTSFNAFIRMYDTEAAEEFKEKYNGKLGVMGCKTEKFHVQLTYNQTIIKVS